MSRRYECADPDEQAAGLADAAACLRRGELVVVPTDTVYGIAADAFSPSAVEALLRAKGRGRDMPVPVLVGAWRTLDGLVDDPPPVTRDLVEAFWPGGLTLVLRHAPTLAWDLGDSRGTVAVRMPLHPVTLALLSDTGPLAVSSANISGAPAAMRCEAAVAQLAENVSVYLDAGPVGGDEAAALGSTILDLTSDVPRVLRHGVVPMSALVEVVPDVTDAG